MNKLLLGVTAQIPAQALVDPEDIIRILCENFLESDIISFSNCIIKRVDGTVAVFERRYNTLFDEYFDLEIRRGQTAVNVFKALQILYAQYVSSIEDPERKFDDQVVIRKRTP